MKIMIINKLYPIIFIISLLYANCTAKPENINSNPVEENKSVSKSFPLLEVNKVRYSKFISVEQKKKFEASPFFEEFEKLRQNLYSILEGGGGIIDIKPYLDEEYFSYSESKNEKDIFLMYNNNTEILKQIEVVWDIKSIKNSLRNPNIFNIQMLQKEKRHFVTWDEYNSQKRNPTIDPPQQIGFVYSDGKIRINKFVKIYSTNDR